MTAPDIIEMTVPADDTGSEIVAVAAASLAVAAGCRHAPIRQFRQRLGRATGTAIDAGADRLAADITVSTHRIDVRIDGLADDGSTILSTHASLDHSLPADSS